MNLEYKLKNDIKKNKRIANIRYKLIMIFLVIVQIYIVKLEYDKYQLNTTLIENTNKTLAYGFSQKDTGANPQIWFNYYNKELNKELRSNINNKELQWISWNNQANKQTDILYTKIDGNFYVKLYDNVIKEHNTWYIVKQLLLIPFIMFIYFLINYYTNK